MSRHLVPFQRVFSWFGSRSMSSSTRLASPSLAVGKAAAEQSASQPLQLGILCPPSSEQLRSARQRPRPGLLGCQVKDSGLVVLWVDFAGRRDTCSYALLVASPSSLESASQQLQKTGGPYLQQAKPCLEAPTVFVQEPLLQDFCACVNASEGRLNDQLLLLGSTFWPFPRFAF